MNKETFLNNLRESLKQYSSEETEKSIDYYSEIIDDRVEDGMNEEDVVASFGSVDDIANKIIDELSLSTLVKCKAKDKSIPNWAIVLLVIGAPLWFSLAMAAFAIVFAIFVVIWSVSIAFWSVMLALAVATIATIFAAIVFCFGHSLLSIVGFFGVAVLLAGLTIFSFLAAFYITKGIVVLSKSIIRGIKKLFR